MLQFSLFNRSTLSLDPDGPIPFTYRILTSKGLTSDDIDLAQLQGKSILITGASGGIGLECARILARVGCRLILTARNAPRAQEMLDKIQEAGMQSDGKTTLESMIVDCESFESLRMFSAEIGKRSHLDMAILNAGVYRTEYNSLENGWEESIQVNVLSSYVLSLLLLPLLSRAPQPGRLLLVSSEAHAWANPKESNLPDLLENLNTPEKYMCQERYYITKLLVVLWAQELAQRVDSDKVLVSSVSPGWCQTTLFRDFNQQGIAYWFEGLFSRTPVDGAYEYCNALVKMEAANAGRFFAYGRIYPPSRATQSEIARDIRSTMYDDMLDILPESIVSMLPTL
ncbi:hypothetical protein MW887_006506 [Aspergillus wentii]|nr:hypothetical protein MW887_006506 [Aspergillus wentii]